jgi:hypothetical protein
MVALDSGKIQDIFRSLCRSSPWRWETLRFEVTWQSPESAPPERPARDEADARAEAPGPSNTVRAWLRRPNALRVESLDGQLLHSTTGINDSRDDFYISASRKSWLLPPHLVTPVYNDLGLIRRRPEAAYGEPIFGTPRWSAMLDPVELAGNAPVPVETPYSNAVEIESVEEVRHDGRRALEAVVAPNVHYKAYSPDYPLIGQGRTLVRIDWQTAVCLYSRALDGEAAGSGHSIRILGVDEYMLDDLFVEVSMHLTDVRKHIPWIA